jgi:Rrf2 family transcriptional regulator, cysteine metabolism repressor
MLINQKKNQYAIQAIFELAKHMGKGPRKISEIAKAQEIPLRFLEVILSQLKGSGFVESKRGFYGGYTLVRPPDKITVGDVLRFMSRLDDPVDGLTDDAKNDLPLRVGITFSAIMDQAREAVFEVYDQTTIQTLLDNEKIDKSDI